MSKAKLNLAFEREIRYVFLDITNTVQIMRSIIFCATTAFLASLLLSGCGGSVSSGSAPSPGGRNIYGTLTLAGPGSAITGTTFIARTRLGISGFGVGATSWYSINSAAGITYPYLSLSITQDNTGNVTGIIINHVTSENTASGAWLKRSPTASEVAVSAAAVTFTNLNVPGHVSLPTPTLTVNGTFRFQPE